MIAPGLKVAEQNLKARSSTRTQQKSNLLKETSKRKFYDFFATLYFNKV